MRPCLQHLTKFLALVLFFASTPLLVSGANEDFAKIAIQILVETHARHFRDGNIPACVATYAGDAKFFVDHKLVARGEKELLELYRSLREADGIRKIEIDGFLDTGGNENVGWAIFNYTKEYDLRNRDPLFLKTNKLEGFSTVNVRQYGTAIFVKTDGHWKIQTMSVFDPEIWEPQK